MFVNKTDSHLYVIPAMILALSLAACGKSEPPAAPAEDAAPVTDAMPEAVPEVDPVAELAAREEEVAKREAELALKEKEAELARREAELAAKERAAAKKPATPKPATTTAAAPSNPPKALPAPQPIMIPAGTQFAVEITDGVSTKTARRGDAVSARLTTDLIVDGRTAVAAGTRVHGTVTERVSGSKEIGGLPTLGLTFDTLVLSPDNTVGITGRFLQQGKSDTGRDAAKIAGGAVLGAVIGKQVDDKKGTVIGGILGGAAGAAAAKNTGTEVELPAGTIIAFVLDAPVEVKP